MYADAFICYKYKVYADMRRGSVGDGRQMYSTINFIVYLPPIVLYLRPYIT